MPVTPWRAGNRSRPPPAEARQGMHRACRGGSGPDGPVCGVVGAAEPAPPEAAQVAHGLAWPHAQSQGRWGQRGQRRRRPPPPRAPQPSTPHTRRAGGRCSGRTPPAARSALLRAAPAGSNSRSFAPAYTRWPGPCRRVGRPECGAAAARCVALHVSAPRHLTHRRRC